MPDEKGEKHDRQVRIVGEISSVEDKNYIMEYISRLVLYDTILKRQKWGEGGGGGGNKNCSVKACHMGV